MQPTVIGGNNSPTQLPVPAAPAASLMLVGNLLTNFPVVLSAGEIITVQTKLAAADIAAISLRAIATMEQEPEVALSRVLDGVLVHVDQFDNPQIYALFQKLGTTVDAQKLPELADQIMSEEPHGLQKFKLMISTAHGRQAALEQLRATLRQTLTGHTKTLVDLVNQMERDLMSEQRKLDQEIATLEQLQRDYIDRYREFAVAVAFMQMFLEKARVYVANQEQMADLSDPLQKAEIDGMHDKLQALESRQLALEGTLTRLPADQLVIRQLQNAAIATLQETTTTATQRFASIKMTLITLNGAMLTTNVQRLANQGAQLDGNLLAVRAKVMHDVVTTAANAPGDNRIKQAEQINRIVTDTKELIEIVDKAKVDNTQKFGQAKQMFADARQEMAVLGQQVR